MTQSNSEIRQLLQKKIFNHPSISKYNHYSQAVFSKLSKCHTKDIGVHQYKCNNSSCGHIHQQYHSCGNRHCPNCGGAKRDQWIDDRMSELLPTKYYHIVFTVPKELHSIFLCNRKKMFDLIFEAGHYTLTKLGRDPQWLGATPGIVSILQMSSVKLVANQFSCELQPTGLQHRLMPLNFVEVARSISQVRAKLILRVSIFNALHIHTFTV